MKNLVLTLLFLGLGGYLGFILYLKWADSEVDASPEIVESVPKYVYPAELTVENAEGRQIEISLVARDETYIQFHRNGEPTLFTYPITDLSRDSKERVRAYPVVKLLVVSNEPPDEGNDNTPLSLEAMHINQLRQVIERIDGRVADLRRQVNSARSRTDRRTAERQIEALLREKQEHEAAIASRQ